MVYKVSHVYIPDDYIFIFTTMKRFNSAFVQLSYVGDGIATFI